MYYHIILQTKINLTYLLLLKSTYNKTTDNGENAYLFLVNIMKNAFLL